MIIESLRHGARFSWIYASSAMWKLRTPKSGPRLPSSHVLQRYFNSPSSSSLIYPDVSYTLVQELVLMSSFLQHRFSVIINSESVTDSQPRWSPRTFVTIDTSVTDPATQKRLVTITEAEIMTSSKTNPRPGMHRSATTGIRAVVGDDTLTRTGRNLYKALEHLLFRYSFYASLETFITTAKGSCPSSDIWLVI